MLFVELPYEGHLNLAPPSPWHLARKTGVHNEVRELLELRI